MENLKNGLKALGIRGNIKLNKISENRYQVFVRKSLFGIWDTQRQTFVD